mgnify:CR=1 FL=1
MLLSPVRTQRLLMLVLVLASSLLLADRANAQVVPPYGQFQPLNQNLTPGTAGQWAALAGKGRGNWSQPLKITLDGGGDVTGSANDAQIASSDRRASRSSLPAESQQHA